MRSPRSLPHRAATTWALALLGVVVVTACQVSPEGADVSATTTLAGDNDETRPRLTVPAPVDIPTAADPVDVEVASAADLVAASGTAPPAAPEVDRLAMSGDLRQAWLLVDALHFHGDAEIVRQGLQSLTGQAPPDGAVPWVFYSDLLLSWNVPVAPGYLDDKRSLFLA